MEAPKEIYVHIRKEPHPSITFSEVKEKDCENIKYIRADKAVDRDALLELLREKRVAITECSATDDRKVAALSVIHFLIGKINEQ